MLESTPNEKKRFRIVLEEFSDNAKFIVFQDTETSVNYVYVSTEAGAGVTALINMYGNPTSIPIE